MRLLNLFIHFIKLGTTQFTMHIAINDHKMNKIDSRVNKHEKEKKILILSGKYTVVIIKVVIIITITI